MNVKKCMLLPLLSCPKRDRKIRKTAKSKRRAAHEMPSTFYPSTPRVLATRASCFERRRYRRRRLALVVKLWRHGSVSTNAGPESVAGISVSSQLGTNPVPGLGFGSFLAWCASSSPCKTVVAISAVLLLSRAAKVLFIGSFWVPQSHRPAAAAAVSNRPLAFFPQHLSYVWSNRAWAFVRWADLSMQIMS